MWFSTSGTASRIRTCERSGKAKIYRDSYAKIAKEHKISRRQFFQTGAAVGAAGALLGGAAACKKEEVLALAVRKSSAKIWQKFPAVITDKCTRMEQKNTVFCRQVWDQDFVKRIMAAGFGAVINWIKKNKMKPVWYAWLGLIFSGLLLLFTLAWVVSSFYEGEAQAARVGAILFGGPAIVLLGITRRKIVKDHRKYG